ncbi:beta-galactosidase/beta-glucuronidase [Flavobacterium araucananum]|uniref:Glycoside hydrolase n=1 Tax=Flavobacterium araucananum TaxID=946678 RepID=A0A227P1V1_9FLAO|nr:sugar-binding domain-containing protein [Flavobacterium araucananum]OXG03937.1 glycoside hydrolase [Flavobacterium araucananum]PWJ98442.1 beta-galactosidase/beta-glucuronidase [Flavobacterium araucananum]
MFTKKILLPVLLFSCLSAFSQISFGDSKKINDNWKFNLKDTPEAQKATYDDSKWQLVNVPHDWSVKGQLSPTLASCTGFLPGGIGWYRKSITIPQSKTGEKVYLYFEGVYNRSEVFINGHSLGKRPNGYISFAYDATPFVKYGAENTISVRVDHSQSADSRWYTGSGIYRDVWLVYANPVHIAQWGVYVYPEVSKATGTLNVEVEVENGAATKSNLTVVNELISKDGKSVGKSATKVEVAANKNGKISTKINVKNPELWDLEHPNLYQLKTTVFKDGKQIDETITKTGFRNFTFDPNNGFALNGQWMKMKGVCLHHDAGVLGSAVPREVWETRLKTLKEIGVNAIRTSHNPQAPVFYELCDELGLLVLNEAYDEWEFPKRKWLEGWNYGTPGFEGTFDIFADYGEKDLEDFVRRDRNHLSVFAWSIGNEVDYPNDPYSHPVLDKGKDGFGQAAYGGYKKEAPDAMRLGVLAKRLVAAVKKYDKSRPTTAGLAGVAMSNETEYPGALDITGYNYTESKYQSDHQKYPNRVIFGSENVHDMEPWLAVKNNKHIFGQFLWTGIDYLGESGRWPSRGFYSGLVDFAGVIKPRGYFRQSLWSDKPMAYVGTYPLQNDKDVSKDAWAIWNYAQGQKIRVVCYTNAAKARLELNGKVVGEIKQYDEKTGIIYWDIPFASGKLEAIGLSKDDKEVSRYAITTTQQPVELTIADANITINKDKGVAKIMVQIKDQNGIPVMLSDNEVTCTISGPGVLLGLEAGNNSDMTDYTDNVQRVYHGHIAAYIQATGEAQPIKVTFTSQWLKPVEVTINVK